MTKKYTEMSKTEYDNVLTQQFGNGVQLVDMGNGEVRVMKFVGYEDGDPEFEMSDAYPKAMGEDIASGGVKVSGIDGVVFV